MNALQRLSITEQDALLMRVAAEGLDVSQLACHMTRQQASGRGRHSEKGGFSILSGQAFNISYNLMLCEYCGNLMPQRVCPWKAEQLKQRLLSE